MSSERWAIICDAREGHNLGIHYLALVDRTISKSWWWTSDDASLILGYLKRRPAEYALARLKHNNARIVTYTHAVDIIQRQQQSSLDEALSRIGRDSSYDFEPSHGQD